MRLAIRKKRPRWRAPALTRPGLRSWLIPNVGSSMVSLVGKIKRIRRLGLNYESLEGKPKKVKVAGNYCCIDCLFTSQNSDHPSTWWERGAIF